MLDSLQLQLDENLFTVEYYNSFKFLTETFSEVYGQGEEDTLDLMNILHDLEMGPNIPKASYLIQKCL